MLNDLIIELFLYYHLFQLIDKQFDHLLKSYEYDLLTFLNIQTS